MQLLPLGNTHHFCGTFCAQQSCRMLDHCKRCESPAPLLHHSGRHAPPCGKREESTAAAVNPIIYPDGSDCRLLPPLNHYLHLPKSHHHIVCHHLATVCNVLLATTVLVTPLRPNDLHHNTGRMERSVSHRLHSRRRRCINLRRRWSWRGWRLAQRCNSTLGGMHFFSCSCGCHGHVHRKRGKNSLALRARISTHSAELPPLVGRGARATYPVVGCG
jgi:hypothetical protein